MTVDEFLRWDWTWWAFAGEVLPLLLLTVCAFGAGYSHGRLVELRQWQKLWREASRAMVRGGKV